MSKYNITEIKEKDADYRKLVSPEVMDRLKEGIIRIIVIEQKYKDKNYSALQLARDLGTNSRYISAVVQERFHCNYSTLVNKYRIEEAMSILTDKRYKGLIMEEVCDMVGFSNRQSFYIAFYKIMNMTPREYKMAHLPKR